MNAFRYIDWPINTIVDTGAIKTHIYLQNAILNILTCLMPG